MRSDQCGIVYSACKLLECSVPGFPAGGRGAWGPELGLLQTVFGYAELRKKKVEA